MAFSSGRNVLTISAQGKREQEQRERWRKGGGEEGREKKHRVKDCIDTKTYGHSSTEMIQGMKRSSGSLIDAVNVWVFFRRLKWRHTHAFIIRINFLHATGGKTHATVEGA